MQSPGGERYCARCATELGSEFVAGMQRPVCPACGYVVYHDPKVAAGTVIERNGRIALVKRSITPSKGRWVFPGGYVDRGEPVDHAAIREAREEALLEVRIVDLLGVFSYADNPVVLVVYAAEVVSGELTAGDESSDAGWFGADEIPWDDLAFPSTAEALRHWAARSVGAGS